MGKLEGKIALITGGTSGIGLATAEQFVNEGAYVFITGRRDAELAAAVNEIGRDVTGIQGDVSKLDDLDRLFKLLCEHLGVVAIRQPPGLLSPNVFLSCGSEPTKRFFNATEVREESRPRRRGDRPSHRLRTPSRLCAARRDLRHRANLRDREAAVLLLCLPGDRWVRQQRDVQP